MTARDESSVDGTPELAEGDESGAELAEADESGVGRPRRRVTPRSAGLALAALLSGAALSATALMMVEHTRAAERRAQDNACVEAARKGVIALLSIDHNRARQDVQRVLDLSSGAFHDDFARDADDFVRTAVDAQAVTRGSVAAAALQSIGDGEGAVLVAASSTVTNAGGARADPRPWRMSVTVTREGDTWKMSDVEFVP